MRSERLSPRGEFVDRTATKSRVARARSKFEHACVDRTVERIAHYVARGLATIDVELEPARPRETVVSRDDVRPNVERKFVAHFDARGAAGPEMNNAPAQPPFINEQLDAGAIGIIGIEAI